MIVPELRKLLADDEEGRLAVRHPLLGFGQFQGGGSDALEGSAHLFTNSLRTFAYS